MSNFMEFLSYQNLIAIKQQISHDTDAWLEKQFA